MKHGDAFILYIVIIMSFSLLVVVFFIVSLKKIIPANNVLSHINCNKAINFYDIIALFLL